MVKYRRNITDNDESLFFLTLVTRNRIPFFKNIGSYQNLINAWNFTTDKAASKLFAWVFLPDHIHVILEQGKMPYSKQVSIFKRRMNYHYCNNEGTIWQYRFWEHTVRDYGDLQGLCDYMHFNPVKHGHASNPKDWEFSSFLDMVSKGYYNIDWSSIDDIVIPYDCGE